MIDGELKSNCKQIYIFLIMCFLCTLPHIYSMFSLTICMYIINRILFLLTILHLFTSKNNTTFNIGSGRRSEILILFRKAVFLPMGYLQIADS